MSDSTPLSPLDAEDSFHRPTRPRRGSQRAEEGTGGAADAPFEPRDGLPPAESIPPGPVALPMPDTPSLLFIVPWLQENALPMVQRVGPAVEGALPYLTVAVEIVKLVLDLIPAELAPALLGLVMVFFGGHYLTTIAAVEAFRMVGWRSIRDALRILKLNFRKARLGLRQDRLKRLKEGHLSPEQEFSAKVRIVLRSVDPERLSAALSSIWAGSLAAIATVRYRYAQTVTLGASLGEVFEAYGGPYLRPVLLAMTPQEYQQWCPVLLCYGLKWVGVCIAWTLQRFISALQSSVRGAQILTDSVRQYLIAKEHIAPEAFQVLFQACAVGVALFGFLWQVSTNFILPFPLNLVCLPFAIFEWFLTAVVNFAPAAIPPGVP